MRSWTPCFPLRATRCWNLQQGKHTSNLSTYSSVPLVVITAFKHAAPRKKNANDQSCDGVPLERCSLIRHRQQNFKACLQSFRRYAPIRTPARKLMGTPTPIGGTPVYHVPEEEHGQTFDVPTQLEGLPELKPEDHQYFGKLLKEVSPS